MSEHLESDGELKGNQNGSGTPFEKIRETYSNAYRPWDTTQDEKLRELFAKRTSISELSKIFERNKGAISSRLKKLGLTKQA